MGKRSQKHPHVAGCEKSGCVWSFVSMLDFRYGRFAPKMLLDRRYETWNHVGTRKQKNMHNMEKLDVDRNDQDGEENMVDKRRPSVKELIEEDLLSELLSKSDTMSAEVGFISERNRTRAGKTTSHRKGSQVNLTTRPPAQLPYPHNSQVVDDQKQRSSLRNKSDKLANLDLETDQQSKPPVGSNVAEQENCESKQANDHSAKNQHKFFRRKSKSFDKTVSIDNKLKPGSETNKGGLERSSSHFSFTEIKRKFKNAMGREQLLEGDRRSLSGKEHFLVETIAKPAMSFRKVENDATRPIECCNEGKEQYQVTNLSKPRQSNIYVEPDKHTTEMSSNGLTTEGVKKNANPLSRILSFPDHNCSSIGSSGIDLWYGFLPARMSFPNMEKFQRLESHLGRISLSSELSDEDHEKALQVSSEPVSTELIIDDGEEMNVDEVTPQGCSENELSSQMVASEEINISPGSTSTSQSVELAVQPLTIQFEKIGSKSRTKDAKHYIVEFIKKVVVSTSLNWEELSDSPPDQILDPSSCQEMELFPNQLCQDKQLLFDCIDEVLVELYDCKYLSCHPAGLSRRIRPVVMDMENTVQEVWERVHWHLMPFPEPHSLEQIVERDVMQVNKKSSSSWMELGHDSQTVLVEISEAIFEDVVEGIIRSSVNRRGRKWRICR